MEREATQLVQDRIRMGHVERTHQLPESLFAKREE